MKTNESIEICKKVLETISKFVDFHGKRLFFAQISGSEMKIFSELNVFSGIMLKQVIEICEQHDAPIVVKDNVVIISLL